MKVKIWNKPWSADLHKIHLKCLFSYAQFVQLVVVALLNSRKETIFFFHFMKMCAFQISADKTFALKKYKKDFLLPSVSLSAIIGSSSSSGLVTTMEVRGVTKL